MCNEVFSQSVVGGWICQSLRFRTQMCEIFRRLLLKVDTGRKGGMPWSKIGLHCTEMWDFGETADGGSC